MKGNLQNLEEVVIIPSALETFSLDTCLSGLLVLEQVECDVAQGGQIGWSSADANATAILSERNVQAPMQCVLNAPMAALSGQNGFGNGSEAGDVIGSVDLCFAGGEDVPFGADAGNGLQTSPVGEGAKAFWPHVRVERPAFTAFDAAMALLDRLVIVVGDAGKLGAASLGKEEGGVLIEPALIGLERQDIIGFFTDNLAGNLGLTAHGIDGDDAAGNFQQLQQLRQGRDLVRFRIYFGLRQHQVVLRGEGAHHRDRLLAQAARTAQLLAVQGNDLSACQPTHRLHPTQKALLKALWVQTGKHATKGVMRWDAMPQVQVFRQPFPLCFAKRFDFHPVIRTTDDAAQGYHQDVDERMQFLPFDTRVTQAAKVLTDTSWAACSHRRRPPLLDLGGLFSHAHAPFSSGY